METLVETALGVKVQRMVHGEGLCRTETLAERAQGAEVQQMVHGEAPVP